MMSKTLALALLMAYAEARFGQEQVPVAAIQALSNFGNPGEAATLAGAVPGVLLAGANACAQVELADRIVTTLGNDQQVIDAAKQLIAAEKNFNPFAVDIPSICDDANLPATEELRGVIPIVDPAVAGSDVQNANSATSLTTPFDANGLSIADISIAQGFDNFTAQASDGSTAPAGDAAAGGNAAGGGAAAGNGAGNAGNDGAAGNAANDGAANAGNNNNAQNGGATQCGGGRNQNNGNNNNNNNNGNGNNNNGNNNNNNNGNNNNGNNNNNNNNNNNGADNAANDGAADDAANDDAANNGANNGAADGAANDGAADDAADNGANNGAAAGTAGLTVSSNAALDFGTCNPAMSFVGGRANRAADEFTFNSVDPRILGVQQEALNPNIITNRICDEVQNRCGANDAAVQACLDAKADLLAQDINAVKVAATATNWNAALGFENVDISQATV